MPEGRVGCGDSLVGSLCVVRVGLAADRSPAYSKLAMLDYLPLICDSTHADIARWMSMSQVPCDDRSGREPAQIHPKPPAGRE